MTAHPVRVAVIGLGLWGARAHLPTFAAMPEFEVRAVVDPRADIAEAAAAMHNVPRVETDAANLFRDRDGIDAVVIATPDDTHRDLTLAAFDAGLHVLCRVSDPITHSGQEPIARHVPMTVTRAHLGADRRRISTRQPRVLR